MGPDAMTYTTSSIKIGSGIQKLMGKNKLSKYVKF
jgi:hypothetical protein